MTPLSRYVIETLVTLIGVVALSVVLLSALRRVGVGKLGGPLELMARLPLEGRRAVYLVRAGETVYVVAATDTAIAKLGELPRASLPAAELPEKLSFKDVLKRAVGAAATGEATPGSTHGSSAAPASTAPPEDPS